MMRARHVGEALDESVKFWAQESWKAGAGIRLSNFRSWKAGRCARKFEFLENLWYNKSLGIELGAQVIPKYEPKFDREVKAGRLGKI